MQHSTGQYDDLARVPRARPREGCRPRTTASRHRRHSPPRCCCRVVPPIRDARFVDLNPAVSHVQLSPAPGTGLQSPETDSQNRRYRDLIRRQRPHVPHLNPRKRPQIAGYSSETGKHRFASDCVVVDAVQYEPISFPAILERQGDFAEMQGGRRASPAKNDWISIIWTGLSLLQEQGGYYSLAGRANRTIAQSAG